MKVFIVYAHAEPRSFNGAMRDLAVATLTDAGHAVQVSDLYEMKFDPVSDRRNFVSVKDAGYFKQQLEERHASEVGGFASDVQAEMEKLFWCDVLIFQFPLWWFGMPAILKGWVDRVFAMGRVYGGGKWYTDGALRGRRGMVATTTGGPASLYSPRGINGHIDALLYPIHNGIFYFVGMEVLPPFVAWSVARASDDQRRRYLDEWRQRLRTLDTTPPLTFRPLSDYDEKLELRPGISPTAPVFPAG